MSATQERAGRIVMGGKPVYTVPGRILNLDSGFKHKLLCDGPTFSAGTACKNTCKTTAMCYDVANEKKTSELFRRRDNRTTRLQTGLCRQGTPSGGLPRICLRTPAERREETWTPIEAGRSGSPRQRNSFRQQAKESYRQKNERNSHQRAFEAAGRFASAWFSELHGFV